MQFAICDTDRDENRCWLISAENKHVAIAKAVEGEFSEDMTDFYYGLDDGQISILEVNRSLS